MVTKRGTWKDLVSTVSPHKQNHTRSGFIKKYYWEEEAKTIVLSQRHPLGDVVQFKGTTEKEAPAAWRRACRTRWRAEGWRNVYCHHSGAAADADGLCLTADCKQVGSADPSCQLLSQSSKHHKRTDRQASNQCDREIFCIPLEI